MFCVKMRLQLCVDPKKRLIPGGKLAFKRAAKGKHRTRKPVPLQTKPLRSQISALREILAQTLKERDAMHAFTKALEKQVSGYMRINSDLIAENEALRAYITRLLS